MAKMIAAVVAFALFASPALAQSCADPGPSPDGNLCETIVPGAGCQCDLTCEADETCCPDVCDVCGIACPDPPSPPPFPPLPPGVGICSQIGCSDENNPFPFSEKNNCFCDSTCVFFNDCCPDSCDACGFCKFGEGEDNIPGDSPLNSIIIDTTNLPQSITQSNEGYPNILDANGPEVFFNFTSPTDITVYFTACDAEFDVAIVVYDFTGEENPDDFSLATVVATNDDPQFCGVGSTGAGTAIIFPAGETAIIQVEGVFADSIGEFTLVINEVQPVCDDGVFNFCEGVTTTPDAVNPVTGCECFAGCANCCADAVDSCLIPNQPPSPPSPPVSCEGFCGGFNAVGGCFCDDLCTAYDDCCPDAIELCLAVPPLPPSPPASCEGFCGDVADSGCFCDELCTVFDDCCPDAGVLCGFFSPPAVPPTCDGFCGDDTITPGGCFCDALCTFYNDCCPDFEALCGTASPPPGCPFIPGDVNDDDVVSVLDLVAISNSILGLAELPEGTLCAADVDGNGIVNVTDVVTIVTLIVG